MVRYTWGAVLGGGDPLTGRSDDDIEELGCPLGGELVDGVTDGAGLGLLWVGALDDPVECPRFAGACVLPSCRTLPAAAALELAGGGCCTAWSSQTLPLNTNVDGWSAETVEVPSNSTVTVLVEPGGRCP